MDGYLGFRMGPSLVGPDGGPPPGGSPGAAAISSSAGGREK